MKTLILFLLSAVSALGAGTNSSENLIVSGTVGFTHMIGVTNSANTGPTVATNGTGIGTSGGAVTLDANANDSFMVLTITGGNSPAASQPICLITLGNAYTNASNVAAKAVMVPANAAALGLLHPPFVDWPSCTTNKIQVTASGTALVLNSVYVFILHVGQ